MTTTEKHSWQKKRESEEQEPESVAAQPDVFQKTTVSVVDRLIPHLKIIALVVVVIGSLLGVWVYRKKQQEKARVRATSSLAVALDTSVRGVVKKPAEAGADAKKPEAEAEVDEGAPPEYPSDEAKNGAVLAALDTLGKKHSGSGAAKQGELLRAATLFQQKKWDDAIAAYKRYLSGVRASDPMAAVAHEGLGYAYEAKAQLDDAAKEFAAMDPDPSKNGSFGEDFSLWHQARIETAKKNTAKAAELLQKLVDSFPNSTLRRQALGRLAALGPAKS